jgi:putative transposase
MSNYDQSIPSCSRLRFQDQSSLRSLEGSQNPGSTRQRIWHSSITDWKKQALDGLPTLFDSPTTKPTLSEQQREEIEAPLFQQIGQLKVENDWLKKKLRPPWNGRVDGGSAHPNRSC